MITTCGKEGRAARVVRRARASRHCGCARPGGGVDGRRDCSDRCPTRDRCTCPPSRTVRGRTRRRRWDRAGCWPGTPSARRIRFPEVPYARRPIEELADLPNADRRGAVLSDRPATFQNAAERRIPLLEEGGSACTMERCPRRSTASRREAAGFARETETRLQTRIRAGPADCASGTADRETPIGTSGGSRSSRSRPSPSASAITPAPDRRVRSACAVSSCSPARLVVCDRAHKSLHVRGVASSASNAAPVPSGRIVRAADRGDSIISVCSSRRQYANRDSRNRASRPTGSAEKWKPRRMGTKIASGRAPATNAYCKSPSVSQRCNWTRSKARSTRPSVADTRSPRSSSEAPPAASCRHAARKPGERPFILNLA